MATQLERLASLEAKFDSLEEKVDQNNRQAMHDRTSLRSAMDKGFQEATANAKQAASDVRKLLDILERAKGARFALGLFIATITALSGTGFLTLIQYLKETAAKH